MTARLLALRVREAQRSLALCGSAQRDKALHAMADAMIAAQDNILVANIKDLHLARDKSVAETMLDRLALDAKRIEGMAQGLRDVAALADPIGQIDGMWQRPNGLRIGKMRVPIGVIGMIYEARPNVTSDAAALCIKSGNGVLLRGGSEAIYSNTAIATALREGLRQAGIDPDCILLIEDTSREVARDMMGLTGIIDLLIPRGGASLIKTVVETSRVPVLETGTGVCHTYVHADADLDMALAIAVNAKCSRPSVCNSMETLLVDKALRDWVPMVCRAMADKGVVLMGCPEVCAAFPDAQPATEDAWDTEYNDLVLNIRLVNGLEGALVHIRDHSTRHSECIVTRDYDTSRAFINRVDAAAVYVNASTRFTDGGEFGFGAEIGISTQKLHARGPVGLAELTTVKYLVLGEGQIR